MQRTVQCTAGRAGARPLAPTLVLALLAPSCTWSAARAVCDQDADCADGHMCYVDGWCASVGAAQRAGAEVGTECAVRAGQLEGCGPGQPCRLGWCDDPPVFEGAQSAVSDGEDGVRVRWEAAADEAPDRVLYHVFLGTAPGGQDFTAPAASVLAETSVRVGGLAPNVPYWLVVRAQDEHGQSEHNVREVRAVPGCVEYATQIQPIFDAHCTHCHLGEEAPRALELASRDQLLAGSMFRSVLVGCRASESLLYMKVASPAPPIGRQMPYGGPYLTDGQNELIRRWIDQGAAESCPAPGRCADEIPPTFSGLGSASMLDATRAELCWEAAIDDATGAEDIVYDVYEAIEPGAQDFAALAFTSTPPGATCAVLGGRVPGERYCWVVRARDAGGNRDANTTESCLVVPPSACIDYASMVQPLFDRRCIHCHGGPEPLRDMSLETYEGAIAGGEIGDDVVACAPDESLMYAKVSMDVPPVGLRMPADGPPYLSDAQIAMLRQWMTEGARRACSDPDPCGSE